MNQAPANQAGEKTTATPAKTPAPATTPNPPRWLWTKRCVLASVLLALGLVGLWLYANETAKQRYQDKLAAIQAQGEPIQVEDLDQSPIPDEDNKAFYIGHAFENNWPTVPGMGTTIIQTKWFNQDGKDHITGEPIPDPITDNQAYLDQCWQVIPYILASQQATQSHWGQTITKHNMMMMGLPELNETRAIAKLLADACGRHLALNQIDKALLCIQAMLAVETSLSATRHKPMITHLVANTIHFSALESLEQTYPHLTPAQAESTRALLSNLQEDAKRKENAVEALTMERLAGADTFDMLLHNSNQPIPWTHSTQGLPQTLVALWFGFKQPISYADAVWYLDTMEGWRDLFNATDSHPAYKQAVAASARLSHEHVDSAIENGWQHELSSILLPALDGFISAQYKLLSAHRLAATALAIKLHQWDHGQYPETLQALVPDYLPQVPIDPMDPKGRTLGYLPNGCSLYRSKDYDPIENISQEPRIGSPDPATAMPIQGPPVVHTIGPSGISRGCPIEVEEDGNVLAHKKANNVYRLNWFALEPWPTAEPTQAHLDHLKTMEEGRLPAQAPWGFDFDFDRLSEPTEE